MPSPRVALVTGAGSGMGQLSAWRLASDAVRVAALDIDPDGLARTAHAAASVASFECDVRDPEAVGDAVKHVEAEIGPIDRVVSAAGIGPTGYVLDQPLDAMRLMMDVNYFGSIHVAKATLPAMLERGSGEYIQFASMAGWLPSFETGGYSASKHAVVAFFETLANENYNRGVQFLCLCPPAVDTPFLEVARLHPNLEENLNPITPHEVLDAAEAGLERGDLFVFPGSSTKTLWRLRRLKPDLFWRVMRRLVESD